VDGLGDGGGDGAHQLVEVESSRGGGESIGVWNWMVGSAWMSSGRTG
jgi:hypothetical protein